MAIIVDEKGLSARQTYIRKILSPINGQIAVAKNTDVDSIRWYAKDPSSSSDHRALIKTCNGSLKANYFEVWQRTALKKWTLKNLYFRIELKKDVNTYTELLAFHIDMLDNSKNQYKKHPHIHIKHPQYESISNAHLAFNLNNLTEIASDLEKFNTNISHIMEMVKNEFIDGFKID